MWPFKRKPVSQDVFDFRESISVGAGPGRFGRYSPQPGTATVEVYAADGNLLAIDTIRIKSPAPGVGWCPLDVPATFVRHGRTNRCHQEVELPFWDAVALLELPQHIRSKSQLGAAKVKAWVSCEQ